MSKTEVKNVAVLVPKVKRVAKKSKENVIVETLKVKPSAKTHLKPAPKRQVDRLQTHAIKLLTSWHAKAGDDGAEFVKQVQKHTRSLLKAQPAK